MQQIKTVQKINDQRVARRQRRRNRISRGGPNRYISRNM